VLNRAEAKSFKGLSRFCEISPYRSELSTLPLRRRPASSAWNCGSSGTGPADGGIAARRRLLEGIAARTVLGGGSILPVDLDFGVDLNAFYDREGLKFFHGTAADGRSFSGESPDVVCHELGHALLDSFKPQLFDAASIEVAAFHESFGDMSAILSALQLPKRARRGTGGDPAACCAARHGSRGWLEQLGWAHPSIRSVRSRARLSAHAVNTFFYRDPEHPSHHRASQSLSSEPHAFSRVFTGRVLRRTGRHAGHDGLERRKPRCCK